MNRNDQAWQRLVSAARRAPEDGRDLAAPYGFATRVAALAMSAERPSHAVFSRRLWLRAAGIACLFAVAAVAANYSVIASAFDDEPMIAANGDDPVAEVVSMGT
jgi:hypothetical protein